MNDSTTDKVFKYSVAGSLVGSWSISSANSHLTGLTIDPANVSNIWIVDSSLPDDRTDSPHRIERERLNPATPSPI